MWPAGRTLLKPTLYYNFSDFFVPRHLPLVQLMVLFGCDPSAEDDCGHNALYYAVKRGSPKMVDEIIDALAKPLSLMRICRSAKTGLEHKIRNKSSKLSSKTLSNLFFIDRVKGARHRSP